MCATMGNVNSRRKKNPRAKNSERRLKHHRTPRVSSLGQNLSLLHHMRFKKCCCSDTAYRDRSNCVHGVSAIGEAGWYCLQVTLACACCSVGGREKLRHINGGPVRSAIFESVLLFGPVDLKKIFLTRSSTRNFALAQPSRRCNGHHYSDHRDDHHNLNQSKRASSRCCEL